MLKWRIFYNILIFISLSLVPWPVYTALLLAGVFLYRRFYESVLWVLVIELLFGPTDVGLFGHYYLWGMLVALLLAAFVKRAMRYYE